MTFRHSSLALFIAAGLSFHARLSAQFTDDFVANPLETGEWEIYDPLLVHTPDPDPGNPNQRRVFEHDDGVLRVTVPVGINLDHWIGVDHGIQFRRSDMPGDFLIETRVKFVGSIDPLVPDAPIFPPFNESYRADLMVYFGPTDVFYWGFHRGTQIALQRSGTGLICQVDPFLQEVSLQIRKVGTRYSFNWRETDADPWQTVCRQDAVETPLYVGLLFKSWAPVINSDEVFEYEYFNASEVPDEAPSVDAPCPLADPEPAWLGMPFIRSLTVSGSPVPDVEVTNGPPDLTFDAARGIIAGWTPDAIGPVPIALKLTNSAGTDLLSFTARVSAASSRRDDEFDEDPRTNPLWEFYEPQTGIQHSTVDFDGSNWWRMQVPMTGDLGSDFDTWTTVDRAPQLRRAVEIDSDFLIETRVRIAPEGAPSPAANFLSGLLLVFGTSQDIIHWNIGQQRTINGQPMNLLLERSGVNNIAHANVPDLLSGAPVRLRIEKKCTQYHFFFRTDETETWTHAATYETQDPVQYAGIVMKTWGGGVAFTTDFDYLDFVQPGPHATFTLTPTEGPEPLKVDVDGGGSSSPGGAIAALDWDFGDGTNAQGQVQSHTYAARGRYNVRLTVTDAGGDKGEAGRPVEVKFRSGDISPWTTTDIGTSPPTTATLARKDGADCLKLLAGGKDIGTAADNFSFTHQTLSGNAKVVARLQAADWPSSGKIGVMLREDLTPGSRHALLVGTSVPAGVRLSLLRREAPNAQTKAPINAQQTGTIPDVWMSLERQGAEFIGSWSSDGTNWTEVGRVSTLVLPDAVYGGIAIAARDTNATGRVIEADLCNIQLKGNAREKTFRRGDADSNASVELTDPVLLLNYLFLAGTAPTCFDAADADDNGLLDLTDAVYNLNYQFLGGSDPPSPGPVLCGPDATADQDGVDLGCAEGCP